MSLRPKLHVSTFHWRTVVSMIGRLCHLFVHALSSLQVANAQCMTLRSLAPCLRAAREKHRFAAGKKHRNGKKHVWQQEKNALQREKAISAAGKTPAKNAASQREKFKAAEKTPCSSTKAPLQQKKCILEAAGKTVRGGKNPSEARKKPAEAGKKLAAEKVQLCNPKSCRNGKNTFPQREKAAARTQPAKPLVGHHVYPTHPAISNMQTQGARQIATSKMIVTGVDMGRSFSVLLFCVAIGPCPHLS